MPYCIKYSFVIEGYVFYARIARIVLFIQFNIWKIIIKYTLQNVIRHIPLHSWCVHKPSIQYLNNHYKSHITKCNKTFHYIPDVFINRLGLNSLQEMMEALNGARRPPKAALGVPQIGHNITVLPAAFLRAWAAQVAGRRRSIVNGAQSERWSNTITD